MKKIDLTGQRFGRLLVIEEDLERKQKDIDNHQPAKNYWKCKCDCGNIITAPTGNLRNGHTRSCGCLNKELNSIAHRKDNQYDLNGEYGKCFLSNSKEYFMFDLEDYDKIKPHCWFLANTGYATTNISKFSETFALLYRTNSVSVQYIIMNITDNLGKFTVIDHINGNKLDNRKCNLRIATRSQNAANQKKHKNNQSGYTGVRLTRTNRWNAYIAFNKIHIDLGSFDTKEEAIKARKEAEEKYFGEFARKEEDK